ncbi:MAG: hypothetical protein ACRECD_04585 [Burkholderiaceae bacterium]
MLLSFNDGAAPAAVGRAASAARKRAAKPALSKARAAGKSEKCFTLTKEKLY